MNYTVSSLTSKADCQALIDSTNAQKADYDVKKVMLEHQQETTASSAAAIEADLAAVTAELAALQTVFASLPPGKTKDEMEDKITISAYKKFQLEKRHEKNGVQLLIGKEFDTAVINLSITEAEDLLQQLNDRKAALPI